VVLGIKRDASRRVDAGEPHTVRRLESLRVDLLPAQLRILIQTDNLTEKASHSVQASAIHPQKWAHDEGVMTPVAVPKPLEPVLPCRSKITDRSSLGGSDGREFACFLNFLSIFIRVSSSVEAPWVL
jgi:hypothetical protein